jgi:phosphate:Na+ symporter
MARTLFLLLIFISTAYLVFISSEFKVVATGIAIFLVGMFFIEDGFREFAGGILQTILEKSTNTLFKAVSSGFFITAIVQSSSLVTVIAISFLSAEMIGLSQAIGIVFGSNIGTTATAWIVAGFGVKVKIAYYAMPMLIFGGLMRFFTQKSYRGAGDVLLGLGFIFLGISYMKEGFETFQYGLDLSQYAHDGIYGILLYVALGAAVTVILQSSSATMAIIITALATGQVLYDGALGLAIGANIGTTVTALLGSLVSNANGRRLAVAHLVFNTVTAVVAVIFISQMAMLVDILAEHIGISDRNYTMKLALFHTLFNVVGLVIVIPFTSQLVDWLKKMFKEEKEQRGQVLYLDEEVIQVESSAILAIQREIEHLYDVALEAMMHALLLRRHKVFSAKKLSHRFPGEKDAFKVDVDDFYQKRIKGLYGEIIRYTSLALEGMDDEGRSRVYDLRRAIGGIVEVLKYTRELQKNMWKYLRGDHEIIKYEYNELRLRIAQLVRDIERLRKTPDDMEALREIAMIRHELKSVESAESRHIDDLIRHDKINTQMATSLMNDSRFGSIIMGKMVEIAGILWIEDKDIRELEFEEEKE